MHMLGIFALPLTRYTAYRTWTLGATTNIHNQIYSDIAVSIQEADKLQTSST